LRLSKGLAGAGVGKKDGMDAEGQSVDVQMSKL
jgi:hypothetical protein